MTGRLPPEFHSGEPVEWPAQEYVSAASQAARAAYEAALREAPASPFTPAQEARLRGVVREEIAAFHKRSVIDITGARLDPTILEVAKASARANLSGDSQRLALERFERLEQAIKSGELKVTLLHPGTPVDHKVESGDGSECAVSKSHLDASRLRRAGENAEVNRPIVNWSAGLLHRLGSLLITAANSMRGQA